MGGIRLKAWKKWAVGLSAALLVLLGAALALFWNELRSLATLERLDAGGMYRMTYYGDYGFDEFLETGAQSDRDMEAFVTRRLLKGLPIDLGIAGAGCTAFAVRNETGEVLFGRNFDFLYAPSLQVFTAPADGYASVSTVNLTFAGYSEDHLPDDSPAARFLTLAAPYLPFDGMNEKGLAIALLAVPEAHPPYAADRVTLNTTAAIRLVLDKAATVDEAAALLRQYNIYFSGDIPCHYLIADASGRSVLAEYWDGALQVVEPAADYQIASNFVAYDGLNLGEGYTEFARYALVQSAIAENGGILREAQALDLLAEAGVRDGETDKLQWSVLYNLSAANGTIFAHRNRENPAKFDLHILN